MASYHQPYDDDSENNAEVSQERPSNAGSESSTVRDLTRDDTIMTLRDSVIIKEEDSVSFHSVGKKELFDSRCRKKFKNKLILLDN